MKETKLKDTEYVCLFNIPLDNCVLPWIVRISIPK